ncbi:hypothetical protein HYH03_015189 [Edaphochlamys debaryana]|uniref:Uncharacterized protein n=1 Tax=Edaphochlamys debaryana TaxID=47281 RepID=A0A835XUE7_9CHLO|nr:hypothetical protein HYH03_015189 [Edaphochlamys debaryana]|eukprot:KAG2486094.1 hypothetical protein HYH03_015189 [Edaphochlamys debaryana]
MSLWPDVAADADGRQTQPAAQAASAKAQERAVSTESSERASDSDPEASLDDEDTTSSGEDSDEFTPARRGRRGADARPARKRRKRPEWTQAEEETLVLLHSQLGPQWAAIAARLPGRTPNEVKNIWHSTIRSKQLKGRSLLRAYTRALNGRWDDAEARRQALADTLHLHSGNPRETLANLAAADNTNSPHQQANPSGGGAARVQDLQSHADAAAGAGAGRSPRAAAAAASARLQAHNGRAAANAGQPHPHPHAQAHPQSAPGAPGLQGRADGEGCVTGGPAQGSSGSAASGQRPGSSTEAAGSRGGSGGRHRRTSNSAVSHPHDAATAALAAPSAAGAYGHGSIADCAASAHQAHRLAAGRPSPGSSPQVSEDAYNARGQRRPQRPTAHPHQDLHTHSDPSGSPAKRQRRGPGAPDPTSASAPATMHGAVAPAHRGAAVAAAAAAAAAAAGSAAAAAAAGSAAAAEAQLQRQQQQQPMLHQQPPRMQAPAGRRPQQAPMPAPGAHGFPGGLPHGLLPSMSFEGPNMWPGRADDVLLLDEDMDGLGSTGHMVRGGSEGMLAMFGLAPPSGAGRGRGSGGGAGPGPGSGPGAAYGSGPGQGAHVAWGMERADVNPAAAAAVAAAARMRGEGTVPPPSSWPFVPSPGHAPAGAGASGSRGSSAHGQGYGPGQGSGAGHAGSPALPQRPTSAGPVIAALPAAVAAPLQRGLQRLLQLQLVAEANEVPLREPPPPTDAVITLGLGAALDDPMLRWCVENLSPSRSDPGA